MLRISGKLRQLACAPNPLAAHGRSQHTGASVVNQDKVYELRTYGIWSQHLKEFLNLTSEEFHLRTSQSKLIGYWTSELGGLNEVVHLWEYDSLEHRAQVRASLAGNTEWIQRYFAKILPMLSGQQNSVVSVVPDIPLSTSADKGFYQLQTLNVRLPVNAQKELQRSVLLEKGAQDDLLVGAFTTVHGSLNTAVLLWKHSSLTSASNLTQQQLKRGEAWANVVGAYSKVLFPHKVSPLQ